MSVGRLGTTFSGTGGIAREGLMGVAAALALAWSGAPAAAQPATPPAASDQLAVQLELMPQVTIERIIAAFKAAGANAEAGRFSDGAAAVKVTTADGAEAFGSLKGCAGGQVCRALYFEGAIGGDPPVGLDRINRWNAEGWFVKALTNGPTAVLIMETPIWSGATDEMLQAYAEEWLDNAAAGRAFLSGSTANPYPSPEESFIAQPSPDDFAELLRGEGCTVEAAKAEPGAPVLNISSCGTWNARFERCDARGEVCQHVAFRKRAMPAAATSVERVTAWNANVLWKEVQATGAAHLLDDGSVELAMGRVLTGGFTLSAFRHDLDLWEQQVALFSRDFPQ
jgi:hypothetical protein